MRPRRSPSLTAMAPFRRAAVAVVLATVLLGACGTSGRTLRDAEPGATAPPRKPATNGGVVSTGQAAAAFALSTDAWAPGGTLPEVYSCDGSNVSPPLNFDEIPPSAAELAVVMTDPDANNFVHWVIAGIPPDTISMGEGAVPLGAVLANNSAGTLGYTGPCPPNGQNHTYEFTLYVLDQPSGLAEGAPAASAVTAVQAASSATAILTGTYRRP